MTESPKSSKIPKRNGSWWRKNWFYTVLITVALLGGLGAFWIPFRLPQPFSKGDSISTLRQSILAATGGILAILTLWENRRKNTLEKDKNDQDHTRQVHAERRSRYTTAIEQLSKGDSATTRLGGVYSLVGLVDEWLADEKTIPSIKERRKEGQVIINNLCAYIRSPFPLAERAEQLDEPYAKDLQKNFGGDKEKFDADQQTFKQCKATLEEERQVRLSIIKEMHEHLHDAEKPDSWSGFDYDFSNAHFFYPIDFVCSYFGVFSNFSGVTFTEDANFFGAEFTGDADFSRATFTEGVDFSGAYFTRYVNFSRGSFTGYVNFSGTIFQAEPIFGSVPGSGARFSCKVDPENYDFEVSSKSPYKIDIWKPKHNGFEFTIPKGAILFDPDEPPELDDNDDS